MSRGITRQPSAYAASNLGFSESGRHWMHAVWYPGIEKSGFKVLDPWSWENDKSDKAISGNTSRRVPLRTALEIGKMNIGLIRQADVLAALLDGADIDSGVSAEIAYAAALKIPVYGLRTDFRFSGDCAGGINLQVYTFIKESGGDLYRTSLEFFAALRQKSSMLRREQVPVRT